MSPTCKAHLLPKDVEPALSATASFDVPGDGTFSNATHGVVVELDPGTGAVEILRYVCVEDCGVASTRRSWRASAAAASPRASRARCSSRSPTTRTASPRPPSFMDYKVPTAAEIPDVSIDHLETPCAFTESGAKGAGEGGTIGAPAAVLNAVNDALRHTGVELDDTPIHPRTVLAVLDRPGTPPRAGRCPMTDSQLVVLTRQRRPSTRS